MPGFLDGQLALVTGASRGIGAATAEALAGQGAHVVITARTSGGLEEVEERIHAAGGSATIAPLDLTDGESIVRLAAAISGRWEKLDILILNAAMLGSLSPVQAIDGKEFNKLLTLNLLAQQALIAAFDPMLRRSEQGRVLAVTSTVGRSPRAFWGAYGASKAALDTLVLAYGDENRNFSSPRVAIIEPRATATQMRQEAFPGEDQSTLQPPTKIAGAIVALLRAGFETGHRLEVSAS
jgi:NAD(P)-dependent dehydrogenase (short-subunit alcohol dehydrogenase family)